MNNEGENQKKAKRIKDDISLLPLSRQRKYQIRKMREGLCIICGEKAYKDTLFCIKDNLKRGIANPGRNKRHLRKWSIPAPPLTQLPPMVPQIQ
jgi:hypothetical protein